MRVGCVLGKRNWEGGVELREEEWEMIEEKGESWLEGFRRGVKEC